MYGMKMDLSGDRELVNALEQLPRRVENRVIRNAMAAGAGEMKRATKAEIEAAGAVDTGALARSIVVKKMKGKLVFIVGPRWKAEWFRKTKKGKWRKVGVKSRPKMAAKGVAMVKKNPGAYAHLVELGRKSGKHGTTIGRGCFRRAFDANARRVQGVIANKTRAGIAKEARKLAR